MKILLAEDEPDLRDIFAMFMEMQLGATVVAVSSGDAAILALKSADQQNTPFDLIVSDYSMPKGNGEQLHKYAAQHNPDIPFVLVSAEDLSRFPYFKGVTIAGHLQKPDVMKPLKSLVNKLFPDRPSPASRFCRVLTMTLLRGSPLSFDLYLRLGPEKFVKVISAGDLFDQTQAARFEAKKIEYLYITREASAAFLNAITENLLAQPPATEGSQDVSAIIKMNSNSLSAISEVTQAFGFTEEAQRLTQVTVENTVRAISADPAVAAVFKNLASFRESYFASHSTALAYIACGLASLLGWQSPGTFYKLTLAALLHDITLGNSPLSEYSTLADFEKGTHANVANRARYIEHPEAAAAIAQAMKSAPVDVSLLIAQHHEMPDGTGFPRRLHHTDISSLSTVFIIAHELLSYRLKTGEEINAADFLNYLNEKNTAYGEGHFRDVTQTLIHAAAQFGF